MTLMEGTAEELVPYLTQHPRERFRLVALAPADEAAAQHFFVTASPEEFERAFDALGRGKERLPVLPPEAFERESLYEEDIT